jgi:predicted anti-sigma-YlaC factor YlaD
MTCRRTRKLLPLYAGADLGPRLERAVRDHIGSCPGCRQELEEYRRAVSRVKAAAKAEASPDWGEDEWRALMARVAATSPAGREGEKNRTRSGLFPRWATASLLGAVIGIAVLSVLFRDTAPRPKAGTAVPTLAEAGREQDVISVTMVSPESGLQVVWFFNKDFEWKGDQE